METAYWLDRKRASLRMAKSATCSEARLAHYDRAGRYSVNAAATMWPVELADSLPPPIYATGSNPSFDDADNA